MVAGGAELHINTLNSFYTAAFIAYVIAFLLIYRGVVAAATRKKFWLNVFPVIIFVLFVSLILFLYFGLDVSRKVIIGANQIFTYSIIIFAAGPQRKTHKKGGTPVRTGFARVGVIVTALGWLLFIIFNALLWYRTMLYPPDLWFFAIAYAPAVYLGLAVAHIVILVGFILWSFHKDTPVPRK